MGVYQFYAKRYDVATDSFIDSNMRLWGFSVCNYKPFPSYLTGTTQNDRYIEHDSLNVMEGVIEARDVYGKAQNGIRFCLNELDVNNNYFIFYANNSYDGGFRYSNVDYKICTSAGSTYYKRAVFESPVVANGVKTGCLSITSAGNTAAVDGKFWIYGGSAFTTESAEAFKNLVNLNTEQYELKSGVGVWAFRAKRYDVVNAKFLDDDYKGYTFATFNDPQWPADDEYKSNVDITLIDDSDITNVFANMSDSMPANVNEIRFCVTDSTTDNYFYFFRRAPRDGGFVYRTVDHQRIFGSLGTLHHYKRAVMSSLNVTVGTHTGCIWYHTTPTRGYTLSAGHTFTALDVEHFKALINMSPGRTIDPYNYDGTDNDITEAGGGYGEHDKTSDPIVIPSPPSITTSSTGLITMFTPSANQLKTLAEYMWANPLFDVGGWKKLFADPMQAILGLSVLPINIPSSSNAAVAVGNISTGINMPLVTDQYVTVECGSVKIPEYWGAYLDYSPYTRIELYLPYCGFHTVSADDIINKLVTITYNVDILSGACCAYVKCAGSILYSFIGQCASTIPITGDNWTNMINGVMSVASAIGSVLATGGETAPQALCALSSVSAYLSMKPAIERSGSMAGAGGLLAYQKPYFIITRPRQALPDGQNKFTGYPSYVTSSLVGLKGYTEIESIHLENIPATKDELDEIEKLLKAGVIL